MWRAVVGAAIGATLLAACARDQAAIAPMARTVFAEDFDGATASGFVRALRTRAPGPSTATLVDGAGVGGGRALRIGYRGGPTGSGYVLGTFPLAEAGLEYTLVYDVRFDRDFQFVAGGKLHGLVPRRPVTGGRGGHPDGWSARVMWRGGGRAETYAYHQEQADRYGTSGSPVRPFRFRVGRYYAVSLHVRLNHPANADGFARLYVDGALVSRQEKVRWRAEDTPDSRIAAFLFSTFHGGDDPGWAPRTRDSGYATVHADFDRFAVYLGEQVRSNPAG